MIVGLSLGRFGSPSGLPCGGGVEDGVAEGGDHGDAGQEGELWVPGIWRWIWVRNGRVAWSRRRGRMKRSSGSWTESLRVSERGQARELKTMTGGARFDVGVDCGGECLEGGFGDLAVGVEDFGVVALGVLVDDGDAGAGGEVVELVEGDLLPGFGDLGGWVGQP